MRFRKRPVRMAHKTFPAPVRGWVENENLAASGPAGALVLENWFPTQKGIRLRGGATKEATIGDDAVTALFTYRSSSVERFFAASETDVYNITTLNDTTPPTPSIANQTSGAYSWEMMGTTGGEFLVIVNGSDYAWYYDGSDWEPIAGVAVNELSYDALSTDFSVGETVTGGTSGASAEILAVIPSSATEGVLKLGTITSGPFQNDESITSAGGSATADGASSSASSVTITNVDTDDLSFVWKHKTRLWFVEGGTTSAWYLPVNAIGGAATEYSLQGVFRKGGALWFGATWSTQDAGEGLDDMCAFFSTAGEVAVYQGTDPSSADTWSLVGVYEIAEPMGPNATMKAGGDLLVCTQEGLVPLSQVVVKDPAALSLAAVSRAIEPSWKMEVEDSSADSPWQIMKWAEENMAIVALPHTGDTAFVVNIETGAWTKYTGWDVQCLGYYEGQLYFGDSNGEIFSCETGGSDNGEIYVCKYSGLFDHIGMPGKQKTAHMARAILRATVPFTPKVSVAVNYTTKFPTAPNVVSASGTGALWGSVNWGEFLWGEEPEAAVVTNTLWVSIGRTGQVIAPQIQVTCGNSYKPDASLVAIDVSYTEGGLVV